LLEITSVHLGAEVSISKMAFYFLRQSIDRDAP
jgi:hypothetical protein